MCQLIGIVIQNKEPHWMRDLITNVASWLALDSRRGVTAIEYGLIASLIAVAIIVAVRLVGTNLAGLFTYVAGKVVAP
jgi:pilus assembly protein Flp/PilA